jgi:GNAT superfamily N-acetyltransferase
MDPRFSARPAVPADYDTYTRLFPELGVDDPIPGRERWEAELLPGTLILEEDGAPIAYALVKLFGERGYVFNVVVDPARRGRGAGGAVMEAIAAWMRRGGGKRWELNVKVDNESAIRLYERCGFSRVYRSTVLSLPWDCVPALPRESASAVPVPVDAADDAALEAAFSVVPGRLADYRARRRTLLRLADPAEPGVHLGLASFDPAFPGAFPFAVARPTLAAVLLEGLRPHARPGDSKLNLVVERDAALAAVLGSAGGTVRLSMFHMEGEIPGG